MGQEDLSISALSYLCEDLKISLPKSNATFSEIGALSADILLPDGIVCLLGGGWRLGVFGLEVGKTVLSVSNVGQEVEVVIKKVYV